MCNLSGVQRICLLFWEASLGIWTWGLQEFWGGVGPHFICEFPRECHEIQMGEGWRRRKRRVRKKRAPWGTRLIGVIAS